MSAEFLHIGVPITDKKEGMTYAEGMKIWMSNPDDYDYKIEYLRFEEGGPFPLVMHQNAHIAYKVDDIDKYIADADEVIFGPVENDDGSKMAFVIKDNVILELMG